MLFCCYVGIRSTGTALWTDIFHKGTDSSVQAALDRLTKTFEADRECLTKRLDRLTKRLDQDKLDREAEQQQASVIKCQ